MPIFEKACVNPGCAAYRHVVEYYSHRATEQDPPCSVCSSDCKRILSRFRVVFTGAFGTKYNDTKKEGSWQEGHWVWRRKTKSGNPEPEYLTGFEQQRQYCRDEGLVNPKDVPAYSEIDSEGKKVSSAGMPGTWI